MAQNISTAKHIEYAVLVAVIQPQQSEREVTDNLEELAFLAETAGVQVVKRFTQRLQAPNSRTFIGEGKLQEIIRFVEDGNIQVIIFDDELSPSQLRNLEKEIKRRIIDRTNLILDIFAQRAHTAYAKTQVELAQYQYLLPRLTGLWTHLERQQGGIGMRGPGEREIETDRRVVRTRIAKLKEELSQIDRQMVTQRKNRGDMVRVSLVGYTNVGKSTLMNLLSKSAVFAENKLFATLDTTVRKVTIGNLPFLLADTVGFIRKLPHQLVESFKSTLDEVREADVLLHIVDISHPGFDEQYHVVNSTLSEIGANDKVVIVVFNKIDAYAFTPKEEDDLTPKTEANYTLDDLANSWMAKNASPCIFISAANRTNIEQLREMLYQEVKKIHILRYPYDNLLY